MKSKSAICVALVVICLADSLTSKDRLSSEAGVAKDGAGDFALRENSSADPLVMEMADAKFCRRIPGFLQGRAREVDQYDDEILRNGHSASIATGGCFGNANGAAAFRLPQNAILRENRFENVAEWRVRSRLEFLRIVVVVNSSAVSVFVQRIGLKFPVHDVPSAHTLHHMCVTRTYRLPKAISGYFLRGVCAKDLRLHFVTDTQSVEVKQSAQQKKRLKKTLPKVAKIHGVGRDASAWPRERLKYDGERWLYRSVIVVFVWPSSFARSSSGVPAIARRLA